MNNFDIFGDKQRANNFLDSIKNDKTLFAFVMSYTKTCEIPGITIAGPNSESMKFTPPADAEFLYYGHCKTIEQIPMTPDGKPTPAIITKTALESSSIPHMTINAGSNITPKLPFIESGLPSGNNIEHQNALSDSIVTHAVEYGRILGMTLSSLTDCLLIGESIPGGTTTALAALRAFGYDANVSSSMPNNPRELKEKIVESALKRIDSEHPYSIIGKVGDPMIPFVAGMLSAASSVSKVMLCGGTQMAAVLAFASKIGFNEDNTAIGTTSYVTNDSSANLPKIISEIGDIPLISIDLDLQNSKFDGLKAYSEGYGKEGVGAGGTAIASTVKSSINKEKFLQLLENQYQRFFISQ